MNNKKNVLLVAVSNIITTLIKILYWILRKLRIGTNTSETAGSLIEQGLIILREDMENHSSFDPTRPYPEKNTYFLRAQQLGDPLLGSGQHPIAEWYFSAMLQGILDYEQASGKHFNKGMVYAYLGIIEIAIRKFDAGIAHLLIADWEDRDFVHDPHGILNSQPWRQFEQSYIFDYLIRFNFHPDATLNFAIDENFLNNLFQGMDLQDRLCLEGTIWAIREGLERNHEMPNAYTQGRLYSGLKDLCLLTETLLRKRQIANSTIRAGARIMLGDDRSGRPGLLTNALSGQGIGYPHASLRTGANDLQSFLDNLENILNTASSSELRRVYCLHLIRNFTGHHFDPSDTATSAGGQSFFDMYEPALINILSAILYFKNINAI